MELNYMELNYMELNYMQVEAWARLCSLAPSNGFGRQGDHQWSPVIEQ
jgi:hypothetical protein